MLIAALIPYLELVGCHLTLDSSPVAYEARVVVEERATLPPPVTLEPRWPSPEPAVVHVPRVPAISAAWAVTPWLRSLRPLRHPWDVRCTGTAARCARP